MRKKKAWEVVFFVVMNTQNAICACIVLKASRFWTFGFWIQMLVYAGGVTMALSAALPWLAAADDSFLQSSAFSAAILFTLLSILISRDAATFQKELRKDLKGIHDIVDKVTRKLGIPAEEIADAAPNGDEVAPAPNGEAAPAPNGEAAPAPAPNGAAAPA